MPQQLWQPSTSSIPSALLAHLLSFRFSILDQEKNAELWQLCLVSIHPNCPILVPTILTTFITFSTFQPWNDSHSRAMPAEQESSGNFQFSNWHESGVGYSYHRRLIVQYIKHCQRALPKLIVPFGNVLYIEYIATLARLALSKLNQIKNTIFKFKKSLATAQQHSSSLITCLWAIHPRLDTESLFSSNLSRVELLRDVLSLLY